ncbi:DUF2076 domain-containing protein [Phytobacter sp. V91]|uniref:DUF2076 domain-containing protein n=1 Tax=Phytobacter sp. V91 TaxID=3369425 RepID=UPI003F5DF37C
MQNEEQRLIEGLFQRLQQAEQQNGARDAQADSLINQFVHQQPAAPYYMTQSILIQEAALKRLHAQVQALQNEVATLKTQQPASGGFLSSLFGGGRSQPQQPVSQWNSSQQTMAPGYGQPAPASPSRSGGFMSGALQTAAGVAGGVVLADMLTSMFHHSQPEEIVNIIEQPLEPVADFTHQQPFSDVDQSNFMDASDRSFFDPHDNDDDFGSDDDGFL